MKNPFRSEAEAFRFVLGTAVYFAAIAIAAAVGGRWWGLGVFVVLTAVVAVWFFRREQQERPPISVPRRGAEDERRVLVVANETVAGAALRDTIEGAVEGSGATVLLVCPALNSPLRHWTSDEDRARSAAEARLGRSIAELEKLGIPARGEVGDADPLQAIEDALRTFGADLIVISTHPEGRSNWLERGVVDTARERFTVPITHVVVDLDAETLSAEPVQS
jgi:nucleotide-binding universal stress UspA family protein